MGETKKSRFLRHVLVSTLIFGPEKTLTLWLAYSMFLYVLGAQSFGTIEFLMLTRIGTTAMLPEPSSTAPFYPTFM
jgi:hypothetical protein